MTYRRFSVVLDAVLLIEKDTRLVDAMVARLAQAPDEAFQEGMKNIFSD